MQWEVTVPYRGINTHYRISLDKNKFFQAELITYDGSLEIDPPPQKLLLFKGVRSWIGSHDNTELLNALGENIDLFFTSTDFLNPEHYHQLDERKRSGSSPEAYPNRLSG